MIRNIIFDLSEVLIMGLIGIEKELAQELHIAEPEILRYFGGQPLEDICLGKISEEAYLQQIITTEEWQVDVVRLKTVIRNNFHQEVAGVAPILTGLAARYELVLLSDHAKERVAYIKAVHPFLKVFKQTFFSFDLKNTKKSPDTFLKVLDIMSYNSDECLFIDDRFKNIEVAESIGITGIHFTDARQLRAELEGRNLVVTTH